MGTWEQTLSELVATRRRALVGYAYLLSGDVREAEDLVQDALVATCARVRAGTDVVALEAYVRKAVLRTYLDGFRRRRTWAAIRHLSVVPDEQPPHESATADHVPARLDVQEALATLSPRERACVVLRHYDDLPIADVAGRLGLSVGTVKRYLSDAHRRLADVLGADAPGTSAPGSDRMTLGGPR